MYTNRCWTINLLIDHLKSIHFVEIETSNEEFTNFDDFITWKNKVEKDTNAQFSQHCAPQTMGNSKVWYWYCHRAGKYIKKGDNIRQLKTQGSKKTGGQCTAHMKVSQDIQTGTITVSYCSYHHNHHVTLAHLTMPHDLRQTLVHKLQQGITMVLVENI